MTPSKTDSDPILIFTTMVGISLKLIYRDNNQIICHKIRCELQLYVYVGSFLASPTGIFESFERLIINPATVFFLSLSGFGRTEAAACEFAAS